MRAEHWLAAHPAGAIERSVAIADTRFTIVARTPEGGVEARVMERAEPIPAPPPNEHPEPPPPARAIATRRMPGAIDWIAGEDRVAFLERTEGGVLLRVALVGADPASDVAVSVLEDAQTLEACGETFVAIGPTRAQVVRAGAAWPPFEHAARAPVRGSTHAESSIHLACDADAVFVGALGRNGALDVHECRATTVTEAGCPSRRWPLAGVTAFDLSLHGRELWVASSGDDAASSIDGGAIHVGALGGEAPRVAAACWSSGHGFCGPGRWASPARGDGPLLLTARDGSDVLALLLDEDHFVPLPGLSTGS
jgi:hypothetical protein